jgi:hypothetical protein
MIMEQQHRVLADINANPTVDAAGVQGPIQRYVGGIRFTAWRQNTVTKSGTNTPRSLYYFVRRCV